MPEFNYDLAANALNKEWAAARPEYKIFCNDGIMGNAGEYLSSPLRIMYLLKESNDDYYNIRGTTQHGVDVGKSRMFWGNLAYWTRVIKAYFNDLEPDFCPRQYLTEPISPIAYVNVKKDAQNKSRSNSTDLQYYSIKDKDFLKRQIAKINPNVIVCCGKGQLNCYRNIYDLWEQDKDKLQCVSEKMYWHDSRIVIDFYHPSGRKSFKKLFQDFREICKPGKMQFKKIRKKLYGFPA